MRKPIATLLLAVLLTGGVVTFGSAPTHATAATMSAPRPVVLPMKAKLRKKLGRVFRHHYNPGFKKLVVEKRNAHYGRIGTRYYAILSVWYRDSPVKNTDAGTTFVKNGKHGTWRVRHLDGSYDPCFRPVPKRLMRAWRMPVMNCGQ